MYLFYVVSNYEDKIYRFDSLIELLKFIKNWWLSVDDEISFVEEALFHQ